MSVLRANRQRFRYRVRRTQGFDESRETNYRSLWTSTRRFRGTGVVVAATVTTVTTGAVW
ncbi:hypothetical protein [Natrinema gelatinilyticum]|uniref:hypothetical protein n=1 Tax=Natrinema gelatinilyticum TaxID=2961571 RepID=UPI0020C3F78C|nr:hypothetical protein [Natrinema gelatinilyticum]